MKELCQERGGEADQSGGGVKTLLTSSKQPYLRQDAVRRTGMPIEELSSTLRADELMPHRRRRRRRALLNHLHLEETIIMKY